MSFDYDLVVIGSTLEGVYAAKKAVSLQARVALVTQTESDGCYDFVAQLCLQEITDLLVNFKNYTWGTVTDNLDAKKLSLNEIKNSADLIKENLIEENSLADLAILGIDVIYGKGEFCRLPKQAFLVNNRKLRSHNFLLATGAEYVVPETGQNQSAIFLKPQDLWTNKEIDLPDSILIFGNSPRSTELSQGLARLGKKIIFITPNKQLLPKENIATNRLFLAQLAADGVEVILESSLNQIKAIENKIWLQIGDLAIEPKAVIFADRRQPKISGLNLEGVGVKSLPQGIIVNEKLQTTNKNIYACGDLLGGDSLPHFAQYEVDIALKNMFSFPWFKRDYQYIPAVMLTKPNLASIGLKKVSLSSINNKEIYVVKQHFKNLITAQIKGRITGYCELIVKSNGEILGATIVGDRAIELINIVAMMMRHKIKLNSNPISGLLKQEIPYVSPSYTEIFNQLAISFQQQKIQDNRKLHQRLMSWFEWRR